MLVLSRCSMHIDWLNPYNQLMMNVVEKPVSYWAYDPTWFACYHKTGCLMECFSFAFFVLKLHSGIMKIFNSQSEKPFLEFFVPTYGEVVVKEDKFPPHYLVIVIVSARFSLVLLILPNRECQVPLTGISILTVFQTYLVLLISFTDSLKCSFETHF